MAHWATRALALAATAAAAAPRAGWVGVYHSATGNVADGHNTTAYAAGAWGNIAQENAPKDGSDTFEQNLQFSCKTAIPRPNAIYGMLIAMTEGGVFNNTNDTDVFLPLPLTPRQGPRPPRGPAGLLQGAARWSKLARIYCPEIAGVVIDDFWTNYGGDLPPPGPPGTCAKCPALKPHQYGNPDAGYFCCQWPAAGHCAPPTPSPFPNPSAARRGGQTPTRRPRHLSGASAAGTVASGGNCCLEPGTTDGCQSVPRCGVNPKNATPCSTPSTDLLSLGNLKDIKAVLSGKVLHPNGTVDHDSAATTPWLKLFVVTYEHQLGHLDNQPLVTEAVLDGVSLWVSGPAQDSQHSSLTSYIAELRSKVPDTFSIFTGGYLVYSSIGMMSPGPFYDLLRQSLALYDRNQVQGFALFAGDVLSMMNATVWQEWDLPGHLDRVYQPHLGTANVTVVDAVTKRPVVAAGSSATVLYNGTTHVTRRALEAGAFSFSGWAGLGGTATHTVHVTATGYASAVSTIRLAPGATTAVQIELSSNDSSFGRPRETMHTP